MAKVDIYMKWPFKTVEKENEDYINFEDEISLLHETGAELYATLVLVPEAFAEIHVWVQVRASELRSRLPTALMVNDARNAHDDNERETVHKKLAEFVALAEEKEAEHGYPVAVMASK